MADVFERESYEFEAGGRSFRIEEFTGLERRRYARKVLELHERAQALATAELERVGGDVSQLDFAAISDEVLAGEEEFCAWLLSQGLGNGVTADWVAENFPASMQAKLMAKIDEINKMGYHVGNVFGRLMSVQAALQRTSNGSASATK